MDTTTNRVIPPSELIVNDDGSIFHLHLKPEQLSDKIVLCGDPARVDMIASHFDSQECSVSNREFHSITGTYRGKRLTVLSHGIGCDNIEIVINELDALANIDLQTRQVRPEHHQLTMVRIGTSGGLQPETPIGTFVAAHKAIGFEGSLFFYANTEGARDLPFEQALREQLQWSIKGLDPYVVNCSERLYRQIVGDYGDIVRGCTIAANGFYAPQGRQLRLPLADPNLNKKIGAFEYEGQRITNFEMESAALSGIGTLLGHETLTVCYIIAGRQSLSMNTNYKQGIEGLVELVLERI